MAPRPSKTEPATRRCALTGERLPPDRLIRFRIEADGRLLADPRRALGGRGLWLKPERALLVRLGEEKSAERRALARAAKRMVRLEADFLAAWEQDYRAWCADLRGRVVPAQNKQGETPLMRRLALAEFGLAGLAGIER
ncbi:DUF448 domain-containing protein [Ferrovibrio sp.]|uniref:DUF448 domain-containing protein n=1 Tax=Ferrovibrio sp. TaxID=1917215 RepID=UPI0025C1A792|nr:DUF448 domain-containing protein [Ferrovibrio sp.]MBX3454557.1 DUF448 domain-containing protein [Ferrovibrio sp.]